MQHEILRFLFLVLPYVFCSTLAALIIWGENIRKLFPRLIIYSLLASITQTFTYQISLRDIQFLLEIISGFLIAWLVFRNKLLWVFKVYATSYVLGIIYIGLILVPASLLIFSQSIGESAEDPLVWLTCFLPAYVLMVAIVYLIKRGETGLKKLGKNLGYGLEKPYPVFIAILLQLVILSALWGNFLLNPALVQKNVKVASAIGLSIFFMLLSFYILLKYFKRQSIGFAISSQEAISDNIMELVNSVKGQRHDYLNHLQVIYGMARQKQIEELNLYLDALVKEVSYYNEILKIENPIISALINAKVSQANLKGITIEVDIQTTFSGFQVAAMNIARILANLIDNAIDAVGNNEVEKKVQVKIIEQGPVLVCTVKNPSPKILDEEEIFSPGITSKKAHSGLGLYTCRKLAEKLHGTMKVSQDRNEVTFILIVPGQGAGIK